MRHVIFRLDKDRYALPLAAIREVVVPPERYTRVPRAPPVVSGVMNLRGRVVTVVELRALLGLPPSSSATNPAAAASASDGAASPAAGSSSGGAATGAPPSGGAAAASPGSTGAPRGSPAAPVDPRLRTDRVVLLDRGRRDLGLLVGDVDGIDSIEKVTPAPGKSSAAVRGVARLRGWAVTVLDPDGLDGLVVQSFSGVSTPVVRG